MYIVKHSIGSGLFESEIIETEENEIRKASITEFLDSGIFPEVISLIDDVSEEEVEIDTISYFSIAEIKFLKELEQITADYFWDGSTPKSILNLLEDLELNKG